MYSKISQHQEMGYDRSVGMFSPDGLLLQVEYAEKAVELGSPVLGAIYDKGILLVADKRIKSKLIVEKSVKKIFKVEENIYIGASGVISDARILIEKAQIICQENRVRFDRKIDLISLVKEIANIKQHYTQTGGLRPFGTSFLIGGFEKQIPSLYLTTPSGIFVKNYARAIGKDNNKINKILEEKYKITDRNTLLKLVIDIFKNVLGKEFNVERLEVIAIEKDKSEFINKEELKKLV